MKKSLALLLASLSVLSFSCCANGGSGASTSQTSLSYGVRYIYGQDVNKIESEQRYFIFYNNGTAKYHYYYSSYYDVVYDYTIFYKYKIVEEENMVFCFYDGIEYAAEANTETDVGLNIEKLMATKDFLMLINGNTYLSEEFLEELPNFGKLRNA